MHRSYDGWRSIIDPCFHPSFSPGVGGFGHSLEGFGYSLGGFHLSFVVMSHHID